jgi:uncharacterized membrane protein YsdA (DUF1294 family)
VFDEQDLGRAEKLLADDDAAQCVYGGAAGLFSGVSVRRMKTVKARFALVLLSQF